jgi:hypothetical protein
MGFDVDARGGKYAAAVMKAPRARWWDPRTWLAFMFWELRTIARAVSEGSNVGIPQAADRGSDSHRTSGKIQCARDARRLVVNCGAIEATKIVSRLVV